MEAHTSDGRNCFVRASDLDQNGRPDQRCEECDEQAWLNSGLCIDCWSDENLQDGDRRGSR